MTQAIDLRGDLGDYFLDKARKIPNAHLESVCKIHQKEKTCRYIALNVEGLFCSKKTPMRQILDDRVKKNQMTAQGDNCEGLGAINMKNNGENL